MHSFTNVNFDSSGVSEMKNKHGYTGAHLLMAFLGGAAAGAATALLTTPHTGMDTRRQINDVLQAGKSRVRRAVRAGSHEARDAFEEVRHSG
jgi:gas vesicle protein